VNLALLDGQLAKLEKLPDGFGQELGELLPRIPVLL